MTDNSASMSDEQDRLIASVPNFMTALVDTLEIDDFDILATDTDGEPTGCLQACVGQVAEFVQPGVRLTANVLFPDVRARKSGSGGAERPPVGRPAGGKRECYAGFAQFRTTTTAALSAQHEPDRSAGKPV